MVMIKSARLRTPSLRQYDDEDDYDDDNDDDDNDDYHDHDHDNLGQVEDNVHVYTSQYDIHSGALLLFFAARFYITLYYILLCYFAL